MDSGWYADPTGRGEQRWWDGAQWTKRLRRHGEEYVDDVEILTTPTVVSPAPPPVIPAAPPVVPATPPPPAPPGALLPPMVGETAVGASGNDPSPSAMVLSFLDQLGEGAKRRPEPRLPDALLAGAGALLAVGLVVLGGGDSASSGGIAILGVLVVAAFYAAVLLGQLWLLPAATAAVSVGIVAVVIGVFNGPLGDGDWALPLFAVAALAIAAYLLPGLRGRTFLLGLGLTALLFSLGWVVGQSATDDFENLDGGFGLAEPDLVTSTSQDAAIVLLILGSVYVVAAMWLDRRGYTGIATAFIVGAILGLASGSTGAVADSGQVAQALLLFLAGVVLALAGHLGRRRATTWIGVAFVTFGAGAFVVALAGSDPAPAAVGLLMALAGGGLGVLAWWLLAKHPLDRLARDASQAGADEPPPGKTSSTS